MAVVIKAVEPGSPADRAGICAQESLCLINDHEIDDVLDYRFYMLEKRLHMILEKGGKRHEVILKKGEYEETGLEFETYLMDQKHSCKNKCIFCFIDQMPPNMRESLYFKDDDSRLSFLFGNYITLTNISEHEIDRIIKMHISPVNISVHTTDPALRVQMMKNPRAAEIMTVMKRFADAGIKMNCQLVLCPGINDGEALSATMNDLYPLYPAVASVAAVPVGLTKFRDGLCPLRPFSAEEAADVIDRMEACGERSLAERGDRLFYPADEFFLKSGRPVPPGAYYGEFAQLENGVGMWASMRDDFLNELESAPQSEKSRYCSLATGVASAPLMRFLVDAAQKKWHNLHCTVYTIINDFFGHEITVAGLLTGGDVAAQLRGKPLGDKLLLPGSMLRSEGDLFLDDGSPAELSEKLSVALDMIGNNASDLVQALFPG